MELVTAPAPFTPKPSVLDRVLGRLFPTDQFGNLLGPTEKRDLERQGLLGLGAGILSQSGPGTNALSALGRAYTALPFADMANRALAIKAYKDRDAEQQAIAQVKAKPRTGTPYEQLSALTTELSQLPGTEHIVGPLSSILDAMKEPAQHPRAMHVVTLRDGIYLVSDDGSKVRIGPAPVAQGTLGSVMGQETRAAARNALAALNQADAILKRDSNADILPPEVSLARGAQHIPVIGTMLSGAMEPAAQAAMTPAQKQFQQAMDQFLHNYSALLPRGGRSVAILQNLRSSFTPGPGQNEPEVRAAFVKARDDLRRTLTDLAAGNVSGSLPGADQIPDSGDEARYPENPY